MNKPPTPSSVVAPASRSAGVHQLHVGDQVQWCGKAWIVAAMHSHPQVGRFVRLETGDGGYDLVHVNGSDGAIEPLTWAIA